MQEANSYFPEEKVISYSGGMEDVRQKVARRANEVGLTLKELSLGGGKNHAYLQQYVHRGIPKRLPEDMRLYLAQQLDLSVEELGAPVGSSARLPAPARQTPDDGEMPVYAAAQGGEGHVIVTFDPIDRITRPENVRHVAGSYGVLVTGDSMIPAYRPGEIAVVVPRPPAVVEADVILYHSPPDGEAEAMIKRRVGETMTKWKLEQHKPEKAFSVDKADWPTVHWVKGKLLR